MPRSPKSSVNAAKRQTTILIIVAVLLILLGGSGIYVLQVRQGRADAEVNTKQSEVGTSEEIARRYQSTLDTYNATMEQLKFVEPSMTQESFVPTLVEQLQNMANSDHLKMTSVRPGIPADPPAPAKTNSDSSSQASSNSDSKAPAATFKIMPVAISVEGTYTQVMTFVYHMTKFPKIVMVQGINISPRSSGPNDNLAGKSPLVGADISLQAYLFDDTAVDGGATAGADPAVVESTVDTGNPIAMAAKRVADVTRSDVKLGDVHDRSQGLLDPSLNNMHSIKGGLGSEQVSVR